MIGAHARCMAHMREIDSRPTSPSVPAGKTCEVCGKTFSPKKPAACCSGRCRAVRSRETRRTEAVRRLLIAEDALRAVRELLEHAPEGVLAVPVIRTPR